MSITSKISAAIVVTAFGLLGLGATQSTPETDPASTNVLADSHWGNPPTPIPIPTDDSHWG